MEDIEKSIASTKSFLFGDSYSQKVWFGTTESIKDYFSLLNWEDTKRVLTVCSSGDHLFNLINKGVYEIDSFDINPLTFPYFNLRVAFMIAFSYEEFFPFFEKLSLACCNERQEYELFSKIKPFIPEPYDYFWEELYRENLLQNKHTIMKPGLLGKLCMNFIPFCTGQLRNQYLSSKEEYEKTKENLKFCKINFQCIDLLDIPKVFTEKYDKILLSNIADYLFLLNNNDFHSFIDKDLSSLLNLDGEIVAAYIYHYLVDNEFMGIHFKNSFDGNYSIFEKNYRISEVRHIVDSGFIEYSSKDAVMIYQKRDS